MNKQLLFSLNKNDFEITAMRAGGPGGQKQNKTSSAIRIFHPLSGASSESRSERSQSINKKLAFEKLVKTKMFQNWLKLEICRKSGIMDEIEQTVNELMEEHNIKTEVKDENDKWIETPCC